MKTAVAALLLSTGRAVDVHPDRLAQIKEIENTPGVLWKAAPHARFASQAPGASKYMMGVNGDQKKAIKEALEQGEIVEATHDSNAAIPESFDSAENWPHCAKIIGDIRDQSNCGCCWAFAGAEAGSDRMCIATNASMMVPLSAQDVCFNGGGFMSMGCNGGQITSPWSYLKKGGLFGGKGAVSGGQYQGSGPFGKGLCSDFSMPHCHHHGPKGDDPYPSEGDAGCPSQSSAPKFSKCDADAKAPHDDFAKDKYGYTGNTVTARGVEGIQKAIMAGGPMEVAFTVYSDFENYASGIYHHVSGGSVGGHAVKVVGWGSENGVNYWKIANSWNPYWGEKGYFRIKFGEGGIDDQAVGSDPSAKWSWAGDSKLTEESFVEGGALKLSWADCSDASFHGKVTGMTPDTLTLGQNTRISGSGTLEEGVSGGTFAIVLKAGFLSQTWNGNICDKKTFTLPLSMGSVTWDSLPCPVAKGPATVNADIKLSAAIPASLAKGTTISITATGSNGDKLLCMKITTEPAQANVVV